MKKIFVNIIFNIENFSQVIILKTSVINNSHAGIEQKSREYTLDKAAVKQQVKVIASSSDVDKLYEVFPEDDADELLDFILKNRAERRKAVNT